MGSGRLGAEVSVDNNLWKPRGNWRHTAFGGSTMTDETKTCQVMMANLQPCGRELYQGDVCVCHSDDPEKDVQAFRQEVIRELTPRGKHESDLTKFVFPAETPNMGNREYRLRAFFTGARFLGSISFENSTFKAGARFNDAVFEKRVMFHETTFLHEASFANADFQEGACFTQATFEDTVTFGKAIFAGVAEFHLC